MKYPDEIVQFPAGYQQQFPAGRCQRWSCPMAGLPRIAVEDVIDGIERLGALAPLVLTP